MPHAARQPRSWLIFDVGQKMDALFQFFGGYLHQDWPEEFSDWREAVRAFRRNNGDSKVAEIVSELKRLIASSSSDAKIGELLLHEFACYYTPRPDLGEPTFREWLSQ